MNFDANMPQAYPRESERERVCVAATVCWWCWKSVEFELAFAETNVLHDFPPSWRHKILNCLGRVQLIASACKQFKWHLMMQTGSAFETLVHKTFCQGIKDDEHCDYIYTYHIDASKLSSVKTNQLKVGSSTSHE
jgi:hypothetical protein